MRRRLCSSLLLFSAVVLAAITSPASSDNGTPVIPGPVLDPGAGLPPGAELPETLPAEPGAAPRGGGEIAAVFVSVPVQLTAVFADEKVRLILEDGREIVLPRAISASGTRYASGEVEFWNKGDEARLQLHGFTYFLREEHPDDPWERARREGVTFRAVGQEPGWFLEIHDGERIHLTLDYGETTITAPISWPQVDLRTGTTTYRSPQHLSPLDLMVTIEERACYDPMNGEEFPAAVTVEFPGTGREYHGCGRRLGEPTGPARIDS